MAKKDYFLLQSNLVADNLYYTVEQVAQTNGKAEPINRRILEPQQ
jgi:hypothetical protein